MMTNEANDPPVPDTPEWVVVGETEDPLLSPAEVARRFGVNPKTVTRWAKSGRVGYVKTPGGRHRFRLSEVERLLEYTDPLT